MAGFCKRAWPKVKKVLSSIPKIMFEVGTVAAKVIGEVRGVVEQLQPIALLSSTQTDDKILNLLRRSIPVAAQAAGVAVDLSNFRFESLIDFLSKLKPKQRDKYYLTMASQLIAIASNKKERDHITDTVAQAAFLETKV